MSKRLPAEWEEQRFVQLTWPHENTDWAPYLKDALRCYNRIAEEISKREGLVIVTESPESSESSESPESSEKYENVLLAPAPTNDTWARDHAFITTEEDGPLVLNDFCFNGWGMKFAANLDNQINARIYRSLETSSPRSLEASKPRDLEPSKPRSLSYRNSLNTILEGGSIESDGRGTILTTTECLLSPNRNNFQSKEEAEAMLREHFGATHILWLDHGYLAGDDTDSHIDTLARLCPNDTIVYVKCDDESDEHFQELKLMEQELKAFRTQDGKPFTLLPLPMPQAVFEPAIVADGSAVGVEPPVLGGSVAESATVAGASATGPQRLPATYANFLIINGAVLVPTYNQPDNDARALAVIQQAFPDREIVGIDCQVLIRQHGSLHCVTMQYPK